MSYLARLDSALCFNCWKDSNKISLLIDEILKKEKLSLDDEVHLLEVWDRLLECDYVEFNPVRINYPKLLEFLDTGEELYSYLQEIGIE